MLKLSAKDGKHALLLNHRQLINEAYNEAKYELKQELFYFHPKTKLEPQRKRKRKAAVGNEEAALDSTELETLNKYLELLPQDNCSASTRTEELPRHWEAAYNLPQLHGANVSGEMQEFELAEATYLIPHAARFYNHNVEQLPALLPQLLPSYDLIVMDPPWRNKYIRRLKRAKPELGYAMLDNDQLALLPISRLIHKRTLVAIWCTNAAQHQNAVETQLLPRWSLRPLHKLKWYKLNTAHRLINCLSGSVNQKQPYELLYVACHAESSGEYAAAIKQVELLLSVPSIVHSHKPPLQSWLRQYLEMASEEEEEPNCLELFARYLQPQCTSIGLEVLKLMDARLYDKSGLPGQA